MVPGDVVGRRSCARRSPEVLKSGLMWGEAVVRKERLGRRLMSSTTLLVLAQTSSIARRWVLEDAWSSSWPPSMWSGAFLRLVHLRELYDRLGRL